jgi:hypothetical protein
MRKSATQLDGRGLHSGVEATIGPDDRGHDGSPKVVYSSPVLVAYGRATTLTQGSGGTSADGGVQRVRI